MIMQLLVMLLLAISFVESALSAEGPAALRQPLPLTLRDAMDAAVNNNPNIRLYRERIEAARGAAIAQFGALLPNLSGTARQSQQTLFLGTLGLAPVRSHPFSIFDARATGSQNIFSLTLLQRWQASREALKVAEMEAETTRLDTMAEVALAYLEVLKAQASAEAHAANTKVFEDLLTVFHGRRGGGMATGLDIARIEAQLENERQQLTTARYEAKRLQYKLIQGMALPFDTQLVLTDRLITELPSLPAAEEALNVAAGRRAEVKAQARKIKTASLKLDSTTSERLPSMYAQGDYGLIGNRWNNTLDTYNIGVFLSVPIFDGGQREGRIRESRSELRQEQIKMSVVLNQIGLEVNDALVTAEAGNEQFGIAQTGLMASLRELELARAR